MKIPHKILINNNYIGVMPESQVQIQMPEGTYSITIQSMIPFFSASRMVEVRSGQTAVLSFSDREKWWDILFVPDLLLWFADFFFTLPEPWGLVYKIFTNGYFILWLLYEFLIRKKYYTLEVAYFPEETGV